MRRHRELWLYVNISNFCFKLIQIVNNMNYRCQHGCLIMSNGPFGQVGVGDLSEYL